MESKETRKISKKNKKSKRKSWLIVIGSLIILLGIFDVSLMFIKPAVKQEQEENALKDFYIKEEQKEYKVKCKKRKIKRRTHTTRFMDKLRRI